MEDLFSTTPPCLGNPRHSRQPLINDVSTDYNIWGLGKRRRVKQNQCSLSSELIVNFECCRWMLSQYSGQTRHQYSSLPEKHGSGGRAGVGGRGLENHSWLGFILSVSENWSGQTWGSKQTAIQRNEFKRLSCVVLSPPPALTSSRQQRSLLFSDRWQLILFSSSNSVFQNATEITWNNKHPSSSAQRTMHTFSVSLPLTLLHHPVCQSNSVPLLLSLAKTFLLALHTVSYNIGISVSFGAFYSLSC